MYAITFSLDTDSLKREYNSEFFADAHLAIRSVLVDEYGFKCQSGHLYLGDDTVDAVSCVMAVQDISARFNWFVSAVRDIRLLRISDSDDLMPAVEWKNKLKISETTDNDLLPVQTKTRQKLC
jgi:virulence-associated protein VapD